MNQFIEGIRRDVTRIVELRDSGMSVDEIIAALMEDAMRKAIEQVLGGAPDDKPAPVAVVEPTTPGFFAVIDGKRPAVLNDGDGVHVRYKPGANVNGFTEEYASVRRIEWTNVKEWQLDHPASALIWRTHTRGESFPDGVTRATRVDARFPNNRVALNVLADNVDWFDVHSYRVVQS